VRLPRDSRCDGKNDELRAKRTNTSDQSLCTSCHELLIRPNEPSEYPKGSSEDGEIELVPMSVQCKPSGAEDILGQTVFELNKTLSCGPLGKMRNISDNLSYPYPVLVKIIRES
jgi:hypothetical protein